MNAFQITYSKLFFQRIHQLFYPICYTKLCFLKKGHTGIIMKKAVKQTFGCNIFNLYKDAFFLENGNTFGEYSRTFINNIAKEIKTGKFDDKENINRLIDLIGEPIIQNHLRKLINEPKK